MDPTISMMIPIVILGAVAFMIYALEQCDKRQRRGAARGKVRDLDLAAGDQVKKSYSSHRHASQRLLQKAKDAELEAFVQNGHREWAAKMNRAAQLNAHAAMVQANLPVGGGMGYQMGQQMAQQAAWMNMEAAQTMQDAADEMDPFNFQ